MGKNYNEITPFIVALLAAYDAAADNKSDGHGLSMPSQLKKLWIAFTAVLVIVVTNVILLSYFAGQRRYFFKFSDCDVSKSAICTSS